MTNKENPAVALNAITQAMGWQGPAAPGGLFYLTRSDLAGRTTLHASRAEMVPAMATAVYAVIGFARVGTCRGLRLERATSADQLEAIEDRLRRAMFEDMADYNVRHPAAEPATTAAEGAAP